MTGGSAVFAAVGAFFRWWLGELAACVPGPLRRLIAGERTTLSVTVDGDWAEAARISRGERKELGRLLLSGDSEADRAALAKLTGGLRRAELYLALPARRVLRKELELPLAAETDLDDLLRFELDRQTPFTQEQARFDYRIVRRDKSAGRIEVELAVAPREAVDRLLSLASGWGVEPVVVTAAGDELSPMPFDLSGRAAPNGFGLRAVLAAGLTLAAVALLTYAVAQPLQWQAAAAREAEQALAEARSAAREAAEMSDALERRRKDARYLVDRKLKAPLVVSALADVTRLLPDDSFLFELQLRKGRIRVRGYAPAAAPLLQLFERHPRLSGARFESPVTRVPGIDKERFDISAALTGSAP